MSLPYLDVTKSRIERLLRSPVISGEISELAMEGVEFLEEAVSRMFCGSRERWKEEIRVAIIKLRDAIRSHISKQTVSQSGSSETCLEGLRMEIQSLTEAVKKMEEDLVDELYQSSLEEDDDDVVASSLPNCSKMIGLLDQYDELKRMVISGEDAKFRAFSVVGMGGIGKTTLARKVYEDRDVSQHFDFRAWVRVGRKCPFKEILRRIVAHLYPDVSDRVLAEANRDDIARLLRNGLKGKKYLIVLDDVWEKYVEYHVQRSYIYIIDKKRQNPFPDDENGSRVLLTTRVLQVNERYKGFDDDLMMRLLNKEESWDLFREKVFAEETCPSELQVVGRKIAESCDGLPLSIVSVANLLSKEEKTLEHWNQVATHRDHEIFLKAYDGVSKVLLPSYNYLPRILKMCFLYMGVFPRRGGVYRSKLINMWEIDGFLELNPHKYSYPSAMECLDELANNNLLMIYQRTTDPTSSFDGTAIIKRCGLHSSLWYLANKIGKRAKFFHVLNSFGDCFGEDIEGQHRLSFHNNVLFGIKVVHESVEVNCASTTHTLLCYGPYHRYQVPVCFGLRLLKELDAITIRFYEFPVEILQLNQLRFLTLTLNGKIPSSISQLTNLQFLIVNQHSNIKSNSESSHLPTEIWDMKELQHLQVVGRDLPSPRGATQERLSTLSGVSAAQSCVEGFLKAIPRLHKLGIRIELAPDDEDANTFIFLDHISQLKELRSLKCVVVNPNIVPPPTQLPILPKRLEKLTLSGLGYPWKEMRIITYLTELHVLKLQNYAFQGPVWEVEKGQFDQLISLIIEDTDLVEWKFGCESFFWLHRVSLKHCYQLEIIEGEFQFYLEEIEVEDCCSATVKCVELIIDERIKRGDSYALTELNVRSSWDDGYDRI